VHADHVLIGYRAYSVTGYQLRSIVDPVTGLRSRAEHYPVVHFRTVAKNISAVTALNLARCSALKNDGASGCNCGDAQQDDLLNLGVVDLDHCCGQLGSARHMCNVTCAGNTDSALDHRCAAGTLKKNATERIGWTTTACCDVACAGNQFPNGSSSGPDFTCPDFPMRGGATFIPRYMSHLIRGYDVDACCLLDEEPPVWESCLDVRGTTDAGQNYGTIQGGGVRLDTSRVTDNSGEPVTVSATIVGQNALLAHHTSVTSMVQGQNTSWAHRAPVTNTTQFPPLPRMMKVVYSAIDRSGNPSSCTVFVAVRDEEPPVWESCLDVRGTTDVWQNYGTIQGGGVRLNNPPVSDNSGERLTISVAPVGSAIKSPITNETQFPLAPFLVWTFDSGFDGWTLVFSAASYGLFNHSYGLFNGSLARLNSTWTRETSASLGSSGPPLAHTGAHFMILETQSSSQVGDIMNYLVSPRFSNMSAVSFHYWMYGTTAGTLAVEILLGGSWVNVWSRTGNPHQQQPSSWVKVSIAIPRSAAQLRFKGGRSLNLTAIDTVFVESNRSATVVYSVADSSGNPSSCEVDILLSAAGMQQHTKLRASDGVASDFFGVAVALSGDTALVGASGDDDRASGSGSVYVFVLVGTAWTQQAKLHASDAAANDNFGQSMALSGDTVVIGAPYDDDGGIYDSGSVYVFVRNSTLSWTQQAKLHASDAAANDNFGQSMALSGDTAVIGAPYDDDGGIYDSGSVYVFVRNSTSSWTQQAKLRASNGATYDATYESFGVSVALSGDMAIVGASRQMQSVSSGSAYVFERNGTSSWTQRVKLQVQASYAIPGSEFGHAVALSGDIAIVGQPFSHEGSAHAFLHISGAGDECASQPCLNAGVCADGINAYACHCMSGWDGINCANNIDECLSQPCANNGTCTDDIATYSCACGAGWIGTNCATTCDSLISYSFESGMDCWTESGKWQRGSSTSSYNTGATKAHAGTHFMYLETSGGRQGDASYLISPTFSAISDVAFYYHMYGATVATLAVEILVSSTGLGHGSTSWANVWSKSGPQQSQQTSSWAKASVAVQRDVQQLRFKGTRGSSNTGDICVDSVKIGQRHASACAAGYITNTGTGTGGTSCTVCPAGKYSAAPNMTSCSLCAAGRYKTSSHVSTTNQCEGPCNAGTYSTAAMVATAATCRPWTVCDQLTQYETSAPSTTNDRICAPLTVCSPFEYEIVAPLATADRTCVALSVCDVHATVSVPPTATSDRVCQCTSGFWGNGTGGTSCTVCPAGKYSAAPNVVACSLCAAGRYKTSSHVSTTSQCEGPCNAGTYSTAARVATAATCTACAAGYTTDTGTGTGGTSCTCVPSSHQRVYVSSDQGSAEEGWYTKSGSWFVKTGSGAIMWRADIQGGRWIRDSRTTGRNVGCTAGNNPNDVTCCTEWRSNYGYVAVVVFSVQSTMPSGGTGRRRYLQTLPAAARSISGSYRIPWWSMAAAGEPQCLQRWYPGLFAGSSCEQCANHYAGVHAQNPMLRAKSNIRQVSDLRVLIKDIVDRGRSWDDLINSCSECCRMLQFVGRPCSCAAPQVSGILQSSEASAVEFWRNTMLSNPALRSSSAIHIATPSEAACLVREIEVNSTGKSQCANCEALYSIHGDPPLVAPTKHNDTYQAYVQGVLAHAPLMKSCGQCCAYMVTQTQVTRCGNCQGSNWRLNAAFVVLNGSFPFKECGPSETNACATHTTPSGKQCNDTALWSCTCAKCHAERCVPKGDLKAIIEHEHTDAKLDLPNRNYGQSCSIKAYQEGCQIGQVGVMNSGPTRYDQQIQDDLFAPLCGCDINKLPRRHKQADCTAVIDFLHRICAKVRAVADCHRMCDETACRGRSLGFGCTCASGWEGSTCEHWVNSCKKGPPDNYCDPRFAQCTSVGPGLINCTCYPGYNTSDAARTCVAEPCREDSIDHDSNPLTPCLACPKGTIVSGDTCIDCLPGQADHDQGAHVHRHCSCFCVLIDFSWLWILPLQIPRPHVWYAQLVRTAQARRVQRV
jgi:hypothetical protein